MPGIITDTHLRKMVIDQLCLEVEREKKDGRVPHRFIQELIKRHGSSFPWLTKRRKKNKATETTFSNLSDLTDELANTNHSNTEDCHVASGAPVGAPDACPQQPANCRVLNGRPKGSTTENKRKKEILLHSLKREICEE